MFAWLGVVHVIYLNKPELLNQLVSGVFMFHICKCKMKRGSTLFGLCFCWKKRNYQIKMVTTHTLEENSSPTQCQESIWDTAADVDEDIFRPGPTVSVSDLWGFALVCQWRQSKITKNPLSPVKCSCFSFSGCREMMISFHWNPGIDTLLLLLLLLLLPLLILLLLQTA